jgi:hypothetical protein
MVVNSTSNINTIFRILKAPNSKASEFCNWFYFGFCARYSFNLRKPVPKQALFVEIE